MRDFVEEVIIPRTRDKGMGYALMVNDDNPLQIQVLVSHTWDEGTLELYFALKTVVRMDVPLFVCFFSMYQNSDEPPNIKSAGVNITEQLGNDAMSGPFAEVLNMFLHEQNLRLHRTTDRNIVEQSKGARNMYSYMTSKSNELTCGYMVVVPTKYCEIFSRMWCCLEIYTAMNMGIPMFISKLSSALTSPLSCENARCGNPNKKMNDDEKSIRSAIVESWGYGNVDFFIRDFSIIAKKLMGTFDYPSKPPVGDNLPQFEQT